MLTQILPGFRHVRTPVIVGALWLLVFWFVWARHWPPADQATGLWKDGHTLARQLGEPVALGALAFVAYTVGSRAIWLFDLAHGRARMLRVRFLPSTVRRIRLGREFDQWAYRFFEHRIRAELSMRDGPSRREWTDVQMLNKHLDERIAAAVRNVPLRWPSEAPDLYEVFDRREAERDLARSMTPPVLVLGGLAITAGEQTMALGVGLLITAVLSALMSIRLSRALARLVIEAVVLGRVKSEALGNLFMEHAALRNILPPEAQALYEHGSEQS